MEFALLLPVLVIAGLALMQVALVANARIEVTHAARAGARVAAVGATDQEVRQVVVDALGKGSDAVRVMVRRTGSSVEVVVDHRVATDVALVGGLIDDVTMTASAHMPIEPP